MKSTIEISSVKLSANVFFTDIKLKISKCQLLNRVGFDLKFSLKKYNLMFDINNLL